MTRSAIAEASQIRPTDRAELSDIDYGEWQWLTHEQAPAKDPEAFASWFGTPQHVRFPNGESLQEVAARTADLLRHVLSRHAADVVVLVGHDSVNRVLLTQLLDIPLSCYWQFVQDPCCINEVEVANGVTRLHRMNDSSHLQGQTKGPQ